MGFSLDLSVPVLTVFFQGLLSFFSPCVLPLIPLYIGYLSGGTAVKGEDGRIYYKRSKVMLHTLFFVIGVSFAFFLLGFGFSTVGSFFNSNHLLFARIGGILIIFFGLYQLGIFGSSSIMGKERRLPWNMGSLVMSPFTAMVMGFTFSFAWTPCVGPALASVLLMAASASTKIMGFALIGVYTLGFVLPFLAVGLFTTSLLEFFKKHGKVVKYTVKIGAVLMILMGILMLTGKMNAVTGYLSEISGGAESSKGAPSSGTDREESTQKESKESEDSNKSKEPEESKPEESKEELTKALDFTLTDQYGNSHTLSDYQGKTVFLNFWATWCPPCRAEMPDIQKLYEEYSAQEDAEVVILGIAAPDYGQEGSREEVEQFLIDNEYTYPVLIDTGGVQFSAYGVYSYPTTFMIDKDGNVFGYASGQLNEDTMRSIIKQTIDGKKK